MVDMLGSNFFVMGGCRWSLFWFELDGLRLRVGA